MREIKFRGKRVDNKEWVYGFYVCNTIERSRIYYKPFNEASSNTYQFVIPETVGQFTGLKDKNRKEIYEGDIIDTTTRIGVCVYHNGFFVIEDLNHESPNDFIENKLWEIIGNIHDASKLNEKLLLLWRK